MVFDTTFLLVIVLSDISICKVTFISIVNFSDKKEESLSITPSIDVDFSLQLEDKW